MGALLPGRADRLASSPLALAVLVGANAVPLLAVLLWDWTVYEVVLFYWVENGVVGALNLPKILVASGGSGESDGPGRLPSFEDVSAGNVVAAAFFVFHYGVFWVVHGVFVFVLAGFLGASGPFEVPGVPVALREDRLHDYRYGRDGKERLEAGRSPGARAAGTLQL